MASKSRRQADDSFDFGVFAKKVLCAKERERGTKGRLKEPLPPSGAQSASRWILWFWRAVAIYNKRGTAYTIHCAFVVVFVLVLITSARCSVR